MFLVHQPSSMQSCFVCLILALDLSPRIALWSTLCIIKSCFSFSVFYSAKFWFHFVCHGLLTKNRASTNEKQEQSLLFMPLLLPRFYINTYIVLRNIEEQMFFSSCFTGVLPCCIRFQLSFCNTTGLPRGNNSKGHAVLTACLSPASTRSISLMFSIVLSWFPPPPYRKEKEMWCIIT